LSSHCFECFSFYYSWLSCQYILWNNYLRFKLEVKIQIRNKIKKKKEIFQNFTIITFYLVLFCCIVWKKKDSSNCRDSLLPIAIALVFWDLVKLTSSTVQAYPLWKEKLWKFKPRINQVLFILVYFGRLCRYNFGIFWYIFAC
jgi:hypothetical protein